MMNSELDIPVCEKLMETNSHASFEGAKGSNLKLTSVSVYVFFQSFVLFLVSQITSEYGGWRAASICSPLSKPDTHSISATINAQNLSVTLKTQLSYTLSSQEGIKTINAKR
jgi:hypothetical protein